MIQRPQGRTEALEWVSYLRTKWFSTIKLGKMVIDLCLKPRHYTTIAVYDKFRNGLSGWVN